MSAYHVLYVVLAAPDEENFGQLRNGSATRTASFVRYSPVCGKTQENSPILNKRAARFLTHSSLTNSTSCIWKRRDDGHSSMKGKTEVYRVAPLHIFVLSA